jgi:hypothetical protein
MRYPTVAEAVRGVRGVYVQDDRSYKSLGFRGFSQLADYGNRVLVLVDGHPTNDNWIWASYVGYDLRADIAERMEDDEMTLTGIGTLRRRPVYSSTWTDDEAKSRMWDDAVGAIVRRVAVDPATGEIHRHLANIVSETWRLVTDAFSLGADPKTPFKKTLGLDPGDYRSRRRLGQTVSLADRDDR